MSRDKSKGPYDLPSLPVYALMKDKMDQQSFTIRMHRTINDPVERNFRLAQLYSFFEHALEKNTILSNQPEAVAELDSGGQFEGLDQHNDFIVTPKSTDENQRAIL